MCSSLLVLGLAITASAFSNFGPDTLPACQDVEIPVNVSVARYILNATVENDWDVAALALNLTRRPPGVPLPVAGLTSTLVESSYRIGATLCGKGNATLVLTHGIIESKKYWNPDFPGGEKYNFITAAIATGYSVLSYDRIGVGSSSKVSSSTDAQFQVQGAVLNELVAYARKEMDAQKVVLFGHSYGSYISALSASQTAVDAVILTGFSGSFANFAPFVAGAGFRIANLQNPKRWGHLDSGYLTTSDLFATAYAYFTEPYFNHSVAEWSHYVGSEPFAIGELPSVLKTQINYSAIEAPVLVLQGQYDVSACGGDCVGLLRDTAALFKSSQTVKTVDNLPAGHNLNLHFAAPRAFEIVFEFLRDQHL
ncbi:alpha/beta-hydrolase [Periconia macrospinosa]|uniref:Alpha/beta-hydrolase n=1 Tax=Periconia macrospinosa TaxID=97972 RepID=A0A2V1DH83_9PLEO|nr:alpha/beta-hydrolase [Periconia macrospinosa]